MTKSPHKLMLRKETLRALNTIDLRRVVGGGGSVNADELGGVTRFNDCPLQPGVIVPGK